MRGLEAKSARGCMGAAHTIFEPRPIKHVAVDGPKLRWQKTLELKARMRVTQREMSVPGVAGTGVRLWRYWRRSRR